MGRRPRFSREDVLDAALRLVAASGPSGVTMAALARELGAPTGSIYHRFESREHLLAELWMDTVESFQSAFVAALGHAEDAHGAVEVTRQTLTWTRTHLREARLLLLHRRQDFVPGAWPPELVARARRLEPALSDALRAFCRRALGKADARAMMRARFALLDVPLGAAKPYLQASKAPPRLLDDQVADAVRAAVTLGAPREARR